ncbi:GIY-YIG nuclease family protein [Microvirga sp. BT688]|uniref:GIY-YIG nuclease family protein n=1 Tax=Microvirga sp. TaxID=1873136 RepID=UPI001684CB22|nr:GIY-YIG nuclease family protein [Microvirga sp.]MBD2747768.1 GIY-YIG nuclease family protein [Microvirga sp.]
MKFVPDGSGCYALTTFDETVLYIGLATNLRRRMNDHLDDPRKTSPSPKGRAILFFWIETAETNKVERTWMNIHMQHEGRLPELNRAYSPTPT